MKTKIDTILENETIKDVFLSLYGKSDFELQKVRYQNLFDKAVALYGDGNYSFFSSPGRTELGGNHTDHNNGCVLAGSIQLDAVCCVKPNGTNIIQILSQGFDKPFIVNLDNLQVEAKEKNTTNALIRGIASAFVNNGYQIGGFDGVMNSTVLQGSGLSSSASIEVLIGTVFSEIFNNGKVSWVEIAKIGQYAENVFFGKPCGLMDQMACASGGVIAIDFEDTKNPKWKRVSANFLKKGYALVVVNTGGSHADLTDDYACIPDEMKKVSQYFGKETLRGLTIKELVANIPELRKKTNDRAILRAFHFLNENSRIPKMIKSLKNKDIKKYLSLVNKSGDSSIALLQNVYSPKLFTEQPIVLGLAVSKQILKKKGICRVHGGGFAGTIQAYVPIKKLDNYCSVMQTIFGENCITKLQIRSLGAIKVM